MFPVEGLFPLEFTWVLTPSIPPPHPPKLFRIRVQTEVYSVHTCIQSQGLKRPWHSCPRWVNAGNKNTPSIHHPRKRNVTTSMVGLKKTPPKRLHTQNLTQNGEPQSCSWERKRRRRSSKYLGQTITTRNRTRHTFDKKTGRLERLEILQRNLSRQAPSHESKRTVFNQRVLSTTTYGSLTWCLTKEWVKNLETSQGRIERKIPNVRLKDRIRNTSIRQRTTVTDIACYVTKRNGNGLGTSIHDWMNDSKWATRSAKEETKGVRLVGRPER